MLPTKLPLLKFYEELVKTQQVLNGKHLGWAALKSTATLAAGHLMRGGEVKYVKGETGQEVELPIAAMRNGHVFEAGDWIEAKLGPVAGGEKQVLAIHDISK